MQSIHRTPSTGRRTCHRIPRRTRNSRPRFTCLRPHREPPWSWCLLPRVGTVVVLGVRDLPRRRRRRFLLCLSSSVPAAEATTYAGQATELIGQSCSAAMPASMSGRGSPVMSAVGARRATWRSMSQTTAGISTTLRKHASSRKVHTGRTLIANGFGAASAITDGGVQASADHTSRREHRARLAV